MANVVPIDEEEAVVFDTTHYKNGINGDFMATEANSAEAIIANFAGPNGGAGKFEDTEKRDIARAVPAISNLLRDVAATPSSGILLDIGAGTGLLLKALSELVPQGRVLAADISPDFRSWMSARVQVEGLANVSVVACTAKDPLPRRSLTAAAAAAPTSTNTASTFSIPAVAPAPAAAAWW
mmetsp:Transcript_26625/g.54518  ORF Transcript_26625/g.54518 Transcript_26625/m.54518 type:complete len:181 (+) Transcript_26625:17-559(+)